MNIKDMDKRALKDLIFVIMITVLLLITIVLIIQYNSLVEMNQLIRDNCGNPVIYYGMR